MIKFQEKLYGAKADIAIGASAGATVGGALYKLGNSLFRKVTEKVPETAMGWMDKAGNVITNQAYKSLKPENQAKYVKQVITNVVNKEGKPVMTEKVIKTSGQVFEDAMKNTSAKGDAFLSKFGTVGNWLKGANKSFWDRLTKLGKWILDNPTQASIIGALIGASIVAGYYLIKKSYNKADNLHTKLKSRMIDLVVASLKSMGYKQDQDFTTNPAQADYLKTKVCIVVSSTKDVVNITVNSVNDPKLEPVARQIIRNLPSGSKFYKRESDKSNELTLAVTHSNNGDHVYVASIVERFIKKKYPVFIVEIN